MNIDTDRISGARDAFSRDSHVIHCDFNFDMEWWEPLEILLVPFLNHDDIPIMIPFCKSDAKLHTQMTSTNSSVAQSQCAFGAEGVGGSCAICVHDSVRDRAMSNDRQALRWRPPICIEGEEEQGEITPIWRLDEEKTSLRKPLTLEADFNKWSRFDRPIYLVV